MPNDLNERYQVLHEFVVDAREKLEDNAWAYIIGGTETETTQRRNRQALDSLALRPRVLNDVSNISARAELFGMDCRLPVFLCPIGGLESFDPKGAGSVARAASHFGIPMMVSSVSKWSLRELHELTQPGPAPITQLYARTDATGVDEAVDQAIAVGSPAFCITVDSAVYSRRERDIAARFVKPWRATGEGDAAHYQAALNWKDIERIRKAYNKPLILKGIATTEDAQRAIDVGVDVIYVSNHGGRQLDHSTGSTHALVPIIEAVKGRAKVLVDGGFCRGTDLVKAMALGADGVGLGRLMCLALAAAGSDGIVRMLEILEEEYLTALALSGVTSSSQLDPSYVETVQPFPFEHALNSAFPLLKNVRF